MVRREKLTGRQREGQLHRKGIFKKRGYRKTLNQSDKQRYREVEIGMGREIEREGERKTERERQRKREKERERERERKRERERERERERRGGGGGIMIWHGGYRKGRKETVIVIVEKISEFEI